LKKLRVTQFSVSVKTGLETLMRLCGNARSSPITIPVLLMSLEMGEFYLFYIRETNKAEVICVV